MEVDGPEKEHNNLLADEDAYCSCLPADQSMHHLVTEITSLCIGWLETR